jgi:death-on-curing protein
MRDSGSLEAATARPMHRHACGETDLCILAAAHAFGIAKAHAFVDGNKRTAFVTSVTFLRANGVAATWPQSDIVTMMERLASSRVDETAFADWVRQGSVAVS